MTMAFGLVMSGGPASGAPQQGDQKTSESMMARMGESDARITALTDQMNVSAGEAKIAAMAALLNVLVEQHKTMRSMMKEMGGGAGASEPAKPEASKPMCMETSPAPATASPVSPAAPSHDHSAK
jgi:hypothetical protein